MLQNCETVKLEDNIEYVIIDKIAFKSSTFVVLSDINNPKNIFIRKMKKKDNKTYFSTLSEEEYDKVIKLFNNLK